eukprot:1765185-Rhodomonas_salina.1
MAKRRQQRRQSRTSLVLVVAASFEITSWYHMSFAIKQRKYPPAPYGLDQERGGVSAVWPETSLEGCFEP